MLTRLVLIGVALLCASPAFAWNDRGHMMVAAVAWSKLDEPKRARVTELLKLNPQFSEWVKGAKPELRDQVAFVRAATWADFIKGADGYTNDGSEPKGPDAARNIGYADKLQHRYWHYKDLPFSPDGTPTHAPPEPNAQTQIAAFRQALGSTASDDIKSYDLAWLLHIVGDVHQPLHATSRFTKAIPKGDGGGNAIDVCAKSPCREKLHGVWDGLLGNNKSPTAAIKAAAKLAKAPVAKVTVVDEHKWFDESLALAKRYVYAPPVGLDKGPYELTPEYKKDAGGVAVRQVALAGARLAKLINDNLK